jgi:signal transduction histidine kinase
VRLPCLLFLLLLGLAEYATAQPVTQLYPSVEMQALGGDVLVIPDPNNAYDLEAVASGLHDAAALILPARAPSLGYPRHRYWARFALHNAGSTPVERLLLLYRGGKFTQDVLLDDGVTRRRVQIGVGSELPSGDLASRHAVLRIFLQPGQTLKVTAGVSTWASLILDYRVISERQLAADDRREYLAFGALGGLGLAIAAYLLTLGSMVRQPTYLWLAILAFGATGYQLFFDGFFAPLALSEPQLRLAASLLGLGGSVGVSLLFVRAFLKSPTTQPRLDRWLLRPLGWACPLLIVATLVKPWPFWAIGGLWTLVSIFAVIVAVVHALLRKKLAVRLFAVAILMWFAINVAFILQLQGVIVDNWHVAGIRLLVLAATLLTFAFAVSERLRQQLLASHSAVKRNEARLAELVDERTGLYRAAKERAELALEHMQRAQQQLVKSEKMASLGQLVAGVAHEVNTPLGVALTASSHLGERSHAVAAQLLTGVLGKSDLQAFIGTAEASSTMIERNLHRAAHLIQSFKQVSVDRTSDGRRKFDLLAFVTELVESLAVTWKGRPVALVVVCPPALVLDSFPGALGQVLSNLVQNVLLHAFDPAQAGEMRIVVRDLDAGRIEIAFSDNGKGGSQEVIAHIFEPFFTTRRNQGGTGLGLHVAFNLVEQKLGGGIQVEGAPGAGLCFRLALPRSAPASDSRASAWARPSELAKGI